MARVLALAHHIAAALDAATLRDQAALARALGFTRARISQLLDLTLLAPEIQEHLLFLDAVDGREPMPERALRRLATLPWNEQRRLFCSAGT